MNRVIWYILLFTIYVSCSNEEAKPKEKNSTVSQIANEPVQPKLTVI